MTGFKILEFKKSQYCYEAIEKALSEKVSEGWKVVSMNTDVSSDIKGVIVVLLQQIIPGEEETMSYQELYTRKQQELEIKKIQREIDYLDHPIDYGVDQKALQSFFDREQEETMGVSNANGAVNGFMGLGMMDTPGNNAPALNYIQPQTGKFCTNCGALAGKGKFCSNCGYPM